MTDTDPLYPKLGKGFFTWGSQWFYWWPIMFQRGHDEHARKTIGVVTWAGSLFYAWPCRDLDCPHQEEEFA